MPRGSDSWFKNLFIVSVSICAFRGGVRDRPAHAAVPEFKIPVRWCVLKGTPVQTDPDFARPQSADKAGFFEDAADPTATNESRSLPQRLTTEAALQYRSGSQSMIDAFTRGSARIVFHATIPNVALAGERMAESFPVLYRGKWNTASGILFGELMEEECEKAWQEGDALYYDTNNDNTVNAGDYRLQPGKNDLSSSVWDQVDSECDPNFGAPLDALQDTVDKDAPVQYAYGYVDSNRSRHYERGEPVYRYRESEVSACGAQRCVTENDVLLYPTGAPGPQLPDDLLPSSIAYEIVQKHVREQAVIKPFEGKGKVKYVDLIQSPAGEYSLGYGAIEPTGIYAVSMGDYELESFQGSICPAPAEKDAKEFPEFPVHGQALTDYSQLTTFGARVLTDEDFEELRERKELESSCVSQRVLVDDPVWIYESTDFHSFEPALMAHEFGHALGLPHGDGTDSNRDGSIDDPEEDDCFFPAPDLDSDLACTPPKGRLLGVRGETFNRTDCFVGPDAGPESEGRANMMQYCWRFSQDKDFNKTRDPNDDDFDGELVFNEAQYRAMENYARACGFEVEPAAAAKSLESRVGEPDLRLSRRVYRVDGWGDTASPDVHWLDIGRYGYSLTDGAGFTGQKLKFRVYFPQNLEGVQDSFEIWLGIDARPQQLPTDGDPETPEVAIPRVTNVREVANATADARFFLRASIGLEGEVNMAFYEGVGRDYVDLDDIRGVRAVFKAEEIPSGMLPPGYEGSAVRGHVFELTFPEGVFPERIGDAMSLLALSVRSNGDVADIAFSSGIRHIPPDTPGRSRPGVPSTNPTCTITNLDGNALDQMPRAGRLKLEARGLLAKRPVLLDVNGVRVQDIQPLKKDPDAKLGDAPKTDENGTVVLLVDGDQIPFSADREDGVPAVVSVGAGASTAICGFEFYEKPEQVDWNCDFEPEFVDGPDGKEENPFFCHYHDMCQPGKFGYVRPSGKTCPDGSLAQAAQTDDPIISGRQGEPLCLVPVGPSGEPNCFNTVLNMPTGADWSTPKLGLAYNFMLWKEDGRPCGNRSLAKVGLDFNSDVIRETCLLDPDFDGVPNPTDYCPKVSGYCYRKPGSTLLKFSGKCDFGNGRI